MAGASSKVSHMEHAEPRRTVVLGIDPGRSTGLYSASIPTLDRALTLDEFLRNGRWLGNACINLSTRPSISKLEAWSEMYDRLKLAIETANPALTVIEYPADGMPKWSGGTARGIDFHMGMFFGFAALAETRATRSASVRPVALMPVTSSKAKGRVGWMPKVTTWNGKRRVTHTQDRETTLRQCREIAALIYKNARLLPRDAVLTFTTGPGHAASLTDHELMALGVLTYYVTNREPSTWGE